MEIEFMCTKCGAINTTIFNEDEQEDVKVVQCMMKNCQHSNEVQLELNFDVISASDGIETRCKLQKHFLDIIITNSNEKDKVIAFFDRDDLQKYETLNMNGFVEFAKNLFDKNPELEAMFVRTGKALEILGVRD